MIIDLVNIKFDIPLILGKNHCTDPTPTIQPLATKLLGQVACLLLVNASGRRIFSLEGVLVEDVIPSILGHKLVVFLNPMKNIAVKLDHLPKSG